MKICTHTSGENLTSLSRASEAIGVRGILMMVLAWQLIACLPRSNDSHERILPADVHWLKGYGVFQRGTDSLGNRLVYISNTLDKVPFTNSGNAIVGISDTGIAYVDTSNLTFHLSLDTIRQAALYFHQSGLSSLSVDYSGTVHASRFPHD
jgi:hypothetical protein